MNEQLLRQRVTGEVLLAYDSIIKAWVVERINNAGGSLGVSEERVQELIDSSGHLTREQVQELITSSGNITIEQVQELIDASIGSAIADSY